MAMPGGAVDEKPWSYPHPTLTIVPEQEPNDTCPGQTIACGDVVAPASYSVTTDDDWYAFEVAENARMLTIGTEPYNGSYVDTYLELYDACGAGYITYDDDSGPDAFSLISGFIAPHAGTWYVKTYTFAHGSTGEYQLFVLCEEQPEAPENDMCDGAIPIERCTNGVLTGNSLNAVNNYDPGIPGPSCTNYVAPGKDVVYSMNLAVGDIVHLTYQTMTSDASFYIVTDCANVSGTCVAGADAGYDIETISYTASTAGTYYVILDAYSNNWGGPWSLTYEVICPGELGVCCVGQTCLLIFEYQCTTYQGIWHPEWTSCDGNPCDIVPADDPSWGAIKNAYR
jgi:hypothetical protein